MEKEDKKIAEIVTSVIALGILIVSVIGVSYAVWNKTFAGSKTNSITTGYISFAYTEGKTNEINISDAIPSSDIVGKNLTGPTNQFDFTVSATFKGPSSINYEIYATPITTSNSLEDYIKVYLTDNEDQAVAGYTDTVPIYSSLPNSRVSGSKRLYSGSLTASGVSQAFKLRVWLADTYIMTDISQAFSFKVNVVVTA